MFPFTPDGYTPKGFLEQYLVGSNSAYSKVGNNPALRIGNQYERLSGGPLHNETTIAGSPSFDLMGPDLDSPEVDSWLEEYKNSPNYRPSTVTGEQALRNARRAGQRYRAGLRGV